MKLCPDCPADHGNPSRDQRDATQDGRCITHHDLAQSRPNAAAKNRREHLQPSQLAEAYV